MLPLDQHRAYAQLHAQYTAAAAPADRAACRALVQQYARYAALHARVAASRSARRAQLDSWAAAAPASAAACARRCPPPPIAATPLAALRAALAASRQPLAAMRLLRNLPLPPAGAAQLQLLRRMHADSHARAEAATPQLRLPLPRGRLRPNAYVQLFPPVALEPMDALASPLQRAAGPPLWDSEDCPALPVAPQAPPVAVYAEDSALQTLGTLALPQHGGVFQLPVRVVRRGPGTTAVYLGEPYLPASWDTRDAQRWYYEQSLHVQLVEPPPDASTDGDAAAAAAAAAASWRWKQWELSNAAGPLPVFVRHAEWRRPVACADLPDPLVLLAAKAECLAPHAIETVCIVSF